MAEHYGVKPKIFTKAWWPYFWMYYKWHVIFVLIAAAIIVPGVWQSINKVTYDLEVTYFGKSYFNENAYEVFLDTLTSEISDADGDGEANLGLSCLQIMGEQGMEQVDQAMYMSHDVGFSDEFTYLYIYDKNELQGIANAYGLEGMFIPSDDWCDIADENMLFCDENGVAYAVSLKDSEIFEAMGVDSDNMYIAIKNDASLKNTNKTAEENAVKVAKKLVK